MAGEVQSGGFNRMLAGGMGATSSAWIKLADLGFQLAKMMIIRMHVFRKPPPTKSTRWFMPGDCWIGRDAVMHTHVFLSPLVSEVALWSFAGVPSWVTLSRSMVKSAVGECHGSRDLRTSNGASSLCGDDILAWWFVIWSRGIVREGDKTWEVSLIFRGENLRSCFNWLCLSKALLNALFCDEDLLLIGRQLRLCIISFPSWRRRFWRSWTSGAIMVVLVLLFKGLDHCSGAFIFWYPSFFFGCVHP
jgi:hypothetical protein